MIGVLLVNLGTPDAPTTSAVRRYLREFLSDGRVIDINPIARWLLVNLIIVPFRSPKSAEAYLSIWNFQGSPLLSNTRALTQKVQEKLGEKFLVRFAMRYGKPSLQQVLSEMAEHTLDEIRVLPLYPQYATSSTESTVSKVLALEKKIPNLPPLRILSPFFDHPEFIAAFAELGRPLLKNFQPDHILFSFHGLPERQILKVDVGGNYCLKSPQCCDEIVPANGLCYRAHCFATARGIAQSLQLNPESYTICFQSRLGRTPWIQPFTDKVLEELVKKNKKKIAVFCPAFVADCLETLEEVDIRYRDQAARLGGELLLIPSLNATPRWVQAVCSLVQGEAQEIHTGCAH